MDEYEKINEAIEYIRWMIKELDPDDMYNFKELRQNLLSIIGYLVMLKS